MTMHACYFFTRRDPSIRLPRADYFVLSGLLRKTITMRERMLLSPPLRLFSRGSPVLRLCFSYYYTHIGGSAKLPSTETQVHMEQSQVFYECMRTCRSPESALAVRKLHAQIISTGFEASIFLQNHLLYTYAKCCLITDARMIFVGVGNPNMNSWNMMLGCLSEAGQLKQAEELFVRMPARDSISWTSMMSAYFHKGMPGSSLKTFAVMVRENVCSADVFTFTCAGKACAALGHAALAVQLHGLVTKFGFLNEPRVGSSIIDMYIKCDSVIYAEKVFSKIPDPNLFCCNSMIYGYSKLHGASSAVDLFMRMPERDVVSWATTMSVLCSHGYYVEVLRMFLDMCGNGFTSSSVACVAVLGSCSKLKDLTWGSHVHARILRWEGTLDVYTGGGLINMYLNCERLDYAVRVFGEMREHNAVSYTSLIGGLSSFGYVEAGLSLFMKMIKLGERKDEFTVATVIGMCSSRETAVLGGELHAHTIKAGLDRYLPVGNSLLTMYARSGRVHAAISVFDSMRTRDVVSWTAMMMAFSVSGDVGGARETFDRMPERNVVAWNSMFTILVRHGCCEEALRQYTRMLLLNQKVAPDHLTYAVLLSACANLALLVLGDQVRVHALKSGMESDVSVVGSAITMYSRCGQIAEAQKVYRSIGAKNLFVWNSMMAGCAQNGLAKEGIEIFEDMLDGGCRPDHVSFACLLSGCRHAGLVIEGQKHFNSMWANHSIVPGEEHYLCVLDLLGRAGLVREAAELIVSMPFKPSAAIWGSLLSSCRTHGASGIAEEAMGNLVGLGDGASGIYCLLADARAAAGDAESSADARKRVNADGVRKNPGCSWIELRNSVRVFTADDPARPRVLHIMLQSIYLNIIKDSDRS